MSQEITPIRREIVHYVRGVTAVERPIQVPERRPPRSVLWEAVKGAAWILPSLLLLYVIAGALGAALWPWI